MQASTNRPLLPKPDRAGSSPVTAGNGAGRGRPGVVRGCPLGTVQDRCEWHAYGTVGEDDPRTPWRRWLRLDRRVRPVLGDHRLVGKSPEGSRQLGGSLDLRPFVYCAVLLSEFLVVSSPARSLTADTFAV
jgi:hypothetical protein